MLNMKRLLSILIPALILCAACSREEMPSGQDPAPKEYVTFSTGSTRISVDGEGKVAWVAGDEITIAYKGTDYRYIADNSGPSTGFSPKTESDKIPVSGDHKYTMTASYGGDIPLAQTISSNGTNNTRMPLTASVEDLVAENDEITLHFSHNSSLIRISFAEESVSFKSMVISGLNGNGDISLSFPDGFDLSTGSAVLPVVTGALNTTENEGVLMKAVCSDGSEIARVIWLGTSKKYEAGALVNQALSRWKTSPAGISSGKEMKEFAVLLNKGCPVTRFTSDGTPGGKVELLADVDISAFAPWVPIGNNDCQDPGVTVSADKMLNNEFDGKGHTVSGLSLEQPHENFCNYGLFGVAAANIHDLTVNGSMSITSGSAQNLNLCAGGLVSTLRPGCTVQRCTTNVAINVAYYGTAALSGGDVYNANSATIHKWQRVGGIAGRCSGVISECENKGSVKFTNGTSAKTIVVNCHYGGIAGQVCEYGSADAGITDCTNSGNIASQGRIGGYSDKPGGTVDISAVYQVFQGMSLGGIAGTLGHMVTADMPAQGGTAYISGCTNNGEIGGNYNGAGGNFGGVAGRTGCDASIRITDCINTKSVHGNKTSSESQQNSNNDFFNTMGGVVGVCHARGGEMKSLSNSGNVYIDNSNTAAVVGGVFGIISAFCGGVDFSDLTNSGGVYTSKSGADTYNNIGGVIGRLWSQKNSPTITLNAPVNTGDVRNTDSGQRARIGGLIGYTNGYIVINDGVNKGKVASWTKNGSSNYCYVGGLIGEVGNDFPVRFNRCKEYGYISYNNTRSYHALVIGSTYGTANVTASACYISGSFGLSGGTAYNIASAADYAAMVKAPAYDLGVADGNINIVTLYDGGQSVGTPWEWNWHEIE